jgi:ketosteroid isomerase-like protein
MSQKTLNATVARDALTCMFWRQPNFTRLFDEQFELFFPYAPPGMPQYFDTWEGECCFAWLNRTVKNWTSKLRGFFTTPDDEEFWGYGDCAGDVIWGAKENRFESQYIVKINVRAGKIYRAKLQMNPLDFLTAAGRAVPVFHMDLFDPAVDEYVQSHPKIRGSSGEKPAAQNRLPKEMLRDNLESMRCGVEREKYRALETYAPDFNGSGCWVPPEMTKKLSDDMAERVTPWVKASSPWMFRDPRGVIHRTDDEHTWFIEMNGRGPANWRGNGQDGHYHQSYFIIVTTDDEGRFTSLLEAINPMNKFNATNISIPTFPYYL